MNQMSVHPLKRARLNSRKTLDVLAKQVSSSKGHLSNVERNQKVPSSDLIGRLCAALPGLQPNDFFPGFEKSPTHSEQAEV